MSGYYALEHYGLGFDAALGATVATTVKVADPAVGADWSITVPGGVYWVVVSLSAEFKTSGQVATRTPVFQFVYGGATFFQIAAVTTFAAGDRTIFSLQANGGANTSLGGGATQVLSFPVVVLPSGAVIQSSTTNIQTNDSWGGPSLYVRQAQLTGLGGDVPSSPREEALVMTPITL